MRARQLPHHGEASLAHYGVLSLWLPGRFGVFPVVVRYAGWVATVGPHQINFPIAIPVRLVGDQ